MNTDARGLFGRPDEEIAQLPVDALALVVLAHIAEQQSAGVQPNRWNILNESLNSGRGRIVPALSEALQWLESKVLVAPSGQTDRDWLMVTRRGVQVLTDGPRALEAAERLDIDLHPRLGERIRRQFLIGEYELAVLRAMREVEIRVRELSGHEDLVGRALVQKAFGREGVVRDPGASSGEQVGLMELISGAISLFRNPPAHREVNFDNPTHAAEVIILGSLLMRLLDHVEFAVSASSSTAEEARRV